MRLVFALLVLFIAWNSFGSAADPVICVTLSAAPGPVNAQGISPIYCQVVATKANITCYPSKQVNFPQQFHTRVYCTPTVLGCSTCPDFQQSNICPSGKICQFPDIVYNAPGPQECRTFTFSCPPQYTNILIIPEGLDPVETSLDGFLMANIVCGEQGNWGPTPNTGFYSIRSFLCTN